MLISAVLLSSKYFYTFLGRHTTSLLRRYCNADANIYFYFLSARLCAMVFGARVDGVFFL